MDDINELNIGGDDATPRSNVGNSGPSGIFPDGYSGPRARMAFGQAGDRDRPRISSAHDAHQIGFFEQITLGGLSFGIMAAVLISVAIFPLALAVYGIHTGARIVASKIRGFKF